MHHIRPGLMGDYKSMKVGLLGYPILFLSPGQD